MPSMYDEIQNDLKSGIDPSLIWEGLKENPSIQEDLKTNPPEVIQRALGINITQPQTSLQQQPIASITQGQPQKQPSFLDKMIAKSKGVPKGIYDDIIIKSEPISKEQKDISRRWVAPPSEVPSKEEQIKLPFKIKAERAIEEANPLWRYTHTSLPAMAVQSGVAPGLQRLPEDYLGQNFPVQQALGKLIGYAGMAGVAGGVAGALPVGPMAQYATQKAITFGGKKLTDQLLRARAKTIDPTIKELIIKPAVDAGFGAALAPLYFLPEMGQRAVTTGVVRSLWSMAGSKLQKGEVTKEDMKRAVTSGLIFAAIEGIIDPTHHWTEKELATKELNNAFKANDFNKIVDFTKKYPQTTAKVMDAIKKQWPQDYEIFKERVGVIDVTPEMPGVDSGTSPSNIVGTSQSALLSQTGTGAGAAFDPSKMFNLPQMESPSTIFNQGELIDKGKPLTTQDIIAKQSGGGIPPIPPSDIPSQQQPMPKKPPKDNNPTVPTIDQEYERLKDFWIGEEDWQAVKSSVRSGELQDNIKDIVGEKKFGNLSKEADKTIQLYIDLMAAPVKGDETRYYNNLSPEKKKRLDLVRNLSPELKKVAEAVMKDTSIVGDLAYEKGVIGSKKEIFTARYWDLEKPKSISEKFRKFGTSTGHAKKRKFNSIVEGWANGYELKVEGATNSLSILKDEINKVIGDRQFIGELSKLKTIDGDPLISTKQLPGYERVEHPNFKKWGWVGSVETKAIIENVEKIIDKTTQTKTISQEAGKEDLGPIKTMKGIVKDALKARGFSEGESSNIMARLEGVKPGDKEIIIKEITEKIIQKEQKVKGIEILPLRAKNMFINQKGDILQRQEIYAPKHIAKNLNNMMGTSKIKGIPFIDWATKWNAITKNWILQSTFFHHQAGGRSYYFGSSPLKVEENFMKSIEKFTPGKAYKLGLDRLKTLSPEIELLIRNRLTVGKVQDWEEDIIRKENTFVGKMLDKYGATKAAKDWINKIREDQADFLFKKFMPGLKINAALIELRRILKESPGIDPNKAARIAADLMNDDFGGLHLKGMGRNPTTQHIFRLFALAPDWTESNIRTMVRAFKGGEEGKAYRKFWGRVIGKTVMATVAMNALLHGDKTPDVYKRAWKEGNLKWLDVDITPIYKAMGGKTKRRKYFSIMGHFKDPIKFVAFPIRSTHNKGSVIYRSIYNAISGEDWAGRKYTGLEVLLKTGKTTKFDPFNKMKASTYSRVPSYLLEQVKNTQPIQVQNLINWYQGEVDGFDAALNSLGVNIRTTYK